MVVTPPFVVQALTYDCQCLPSLSTRHKVMGSPHVLELATAGQQSWMSHWLPLGLLGQKACLRDG